MFMLELKGTMSEKKSVFEVFVYLHFLEIELVLCV